MNMRTYPRITTILKFGLAAFAMGTFFEASVSAKAAQLVWVRAQKVDHFRAVGLVPPLAFSGRSSIEGRVENHRGTINLLKSIEQEQKPENPPVHPGRPYNRHDAADRDVVAVSPSSTYRVLKAAGDRSDSRHALDPTPTRKAKSRRPLQSISPVRA
jgi:hypothetical protein